MAIAVWFYWLNPLLRRQDPVWQAQFTLKAYWNQVQRDIRRSGWLHEDSIIVGAYGDKSWAERIMSGAGKGEDITSCESGHRGDALRWITCNNPAGTNWITEGYWLAWWSTNRDKTQVEWIQSGLRTYGISVHIPPAETDDEPLLAVLGNSSTNATEKIPRFVKYNAFRWLRDSGFQAIPFALSNITVQTPGPVRAGLLEYGKWERAFSKADEVGILEFDARTPNSSARHRPLFGDVPFGITVYALMVLPMVGGLILLVYSFRKQRMVEPDGAASAAPPHR